MKKAGVSVNHNKSSAAVLGANPSKSKKVTVEMSSPRGFGRGSLLKKGILNNTVLETPQIKKNGRPSNIKSIASTADMATGTSGRPTIASTILNDTDKRDYRHSQNLKPQSILAPPNFDKEFSSK